MQHYLTDDPDEARRLTALGGTAVYALTEDGVTSAPLCIPPSLLPPEADTDALPDGG